MHEGEIDGERERRKDDRSRNRNGCMKGIIEGERE